MNTILPINVVKSQKTPIQKAVDDVLIELEEIYKEIKDNESDRFTITFMPV